MELGGPELPWIVAAKVSTALDGEWPDSLAGLTDWAVETAESVYALLDVREIVESLIRHDAEDVVAKSNVRSKGSMPDNYVSSPIQDKMTALTVLNRRIAALGIDQPIDVTASLRPD